MDSRLLIGHAVKVAILVALVGLYVRGRSARSLSVVAYLWCALAGNALTTFWPAVFYNYEFWARRQAVFDLLKLAMAVEISIRALAAFPGARARWQRAFTAAMVFGTSAAFLFLPRPPEPGTLFPYQPQVAVGTGWLFTITAFVVVYYRIPLDEWYRAVLLGLASYHFVFVVAMALARESGLESLPFMGLVDSAAYLVLMAWWAQAAWRREESLLHVSPETRRLLRLERA